MSKTNKIDKLKELIENSGISKEELAEILEVNKFTNLEHTLLDYHRQERSGQPEVIYGENKTPGQICDIIRAMREKKIPVLATRIEKEKAAVILDRISDSQYCEISQTITIQNDPAVVIREDTGKAAIVTAGTSDMKVALEAQKTIEIMGFASQIISDVGVAGIHRLFANLEEIKKADVVIVIAGMEGALASVIAGLVSQPVIAVPTSVGYGANFRGVSALLGMLTSCSGGITVVNIDNGFGAASAAIRILNSRNKNIKEN